MSNEFAINCKTGRLLKKSTALYRKLKKLGQIKEIEIEEQQEKPKVEKVKTVEVKAVEPLEEPVEYDPKRLQEKLADISTDLIKDNLKQIVKAHKLSDNEMDDMLRRLLYKKLCIEQPKPKEEKKKKKKSKFKIIESSSSDSESD
jgi:hypothetical protein